MTSPVQYSQLYVLSQKVHLKHYYHCIVFSLFSALSPFRGLELILKGLLGTAENWETIEDMKNIFWYKRTTMSGGCLFQVFQFCSIAHHKATVTNVTVIVSQ